MTKITMKKYKVTTRRVEEFYKTFFITAKNREEALADTVELMDEGIEYDFFGESTCMAEDIIDINECEA